MDFSLLSCSGKILKIPWKSQGKLRNFNSQKCGHPDRPEPNSGKLIAKKEQILNTIQACEQREGKERGKKKREPVGMAKHFYFQMPVLYVMFKLTI